MNQYCFQWDINFKILFLNALLKDTIAGIAFVCFFFFQATEYIATWIPKLI